MGKYLDSVFRLYVYKSVNEFMMKVRYNVGRDIYENILLVLRLDFRNVCIFCMLVTVYLTHFIYTMIME